MRKILLITIGLLFLSCFIVDQSGMTGAAPAFASDAAEGESDSHSDSPIQFSKDLVIWSIITFFILLILLKKTAWTPLIEALDTREASLVQVRAQAEADRQQAQQLLSEHKQILSDADNEIKGLLEEARRDADQARKHILDEAEKEATATKERVIAEIQRAKDAALKEIFSTMSDQVTYATEHVLGRALNEDDQNRLVAEALEQIQG